MWARVSYSEAGASNLAALVEEVPPNKMLLVMGILFCGTSSTNCPFKFASVIFSLNYF